MTDRSDKLRSDIRYSRRCEHCEGLLQLRRDPDNTLVWCHVGLDRHCPTHHRRTTTATLAVALGGVVLAVSALFGAPAASAYPGDPAPACESNPLGALICDGPIRPDGSWQRCATSPGQYYGRIGLGQMTTCRVVTIETCAPVPGLWPDHHID